MFGCRRNANFRLGLYLLALQIHSQKHCLAKTSRTSGRKESVVGFRVIGLYQSSGISNVIQADFYDIDHQSTVNFNENLLLRVPQILRCRSGIIKVKVVFI